MDQPKPSRDTHQNYPLTAEHEQNVVVGGLVVDGHAEWHKERGTKNREGIIAGLVALKNWFGNLF